MGGGGGSHLWLIDFSGAGPYTGISVPWHPGGQCSQRLARASQDWKTNTPRQ